MKKFFKRSEVQSILETNGLNAKVTYIDREEIGSPDNVIIYERVAPNPHLFADDILHIYKVMIQVSHYRKRKLDSIEPLMIENFNCPVTNYAVKQLDQDYYCDYYHFEILSNGDW